MKRSPFFLLLFVVFQTALFSAHASPLGDSPRHVPLDEYVRPAASDLIYNGRLLFPAEATQLKKQGTDISQLNPAESDVYKNQATAQSDNLNIQSGARVKYLEVIASPLKFYRFNVQDRATGEMHTILLGKRAQTLLLRKAMLRRLGYQIPAMKRLARLTVEFSSSIAKTDFIENRGTGLQMNADGDKEWILNLADKNSNVIEFQDVIALSPTPAITNVAEGFLEPLIKGRRAINGLILPYNLVDVTSVEGLRWCSNPVRQNAINFPLYDNEAFSTSIDDLRWMMRKVSRLTRQDFVEIVKEAQFPYPSDLLMVEKLIARRNCARRIIKTEGQDIPFNPQVSAPPHLVDGQLLKEEFEGFAARYAMGEEESPVAPKEIFSLFESKVIGTAIDKLVSKINSDILPFTSPAQIGMNKQQDELLKDLLSFIKTGKPRSRDFGIWATPFLQGNLIASREVVAGSYMGTDNRISLVDTFGFAVETGLTGGALGLSPSKLLTGQASMSYLKQFAHVRPLDSVKNSLKEPYRNIIVPLVKKDIAKVIPTGLAAQFEKLDYEAQVTKAKEIVEVFKSELHDGESIIITESFGPSLGVFAGIDLGKEVLFEKRLVAQAAIRAQQQTISRLHLLRIGDKIHVYKDRGNIKSLSFIVALQANIEVLNIRAKFTKGTASTAFYQASIDPNLDANPDLVLNLAAIRDVLMKSNISKLKSVDDPEILEHKLKEGQFEINFLIWNHLSLKQADRIKVLRAKETQPEYYLRSLRGERNGQDFQTLSVNVLNELIAEALSGNVKVSNALTGDPADSILGKSHARYSYFEGEVNPAIAPAKETFREKFVGVVYRWKGWSAEKAKLQKIIADYSARYNFKFFEDNTFSLINKAQLYTLTLRIFVYDKGINHIGSRPEKEVEQIFKDHFRAKSRADKQQEQQDALRSFFVYRNNWARAVADGKTSRAADQITQLVSLLEASLDKDGLIKIVGGTRNILIQSILQGFLKGEDGAYAKIPVEGHQIGEFGSANYAGPLTTLQLDLGMTESEFFVYWLLRRI